MNKRALLVLGLVLSFNSYGDQTGDCTAGTQYCEQNSLDTTNNTTTNNSNTNVNTNTDTMSPWNRHPDFFQCIHISTVYMCI